jgi:acyl carrier protein
MADRTIKERVLDVLKEQTGKETINLTDTFRGDLKFDSLDAMECVLMLETEFGYDLDDDTVAQFSNVGELVKHMEGRVNG